LSYIREFASFSGECPFQCLHCYTFCNGYENESFPYVDCIINDLQNKMPFDIIYVSGHKENFIDIDLGLELVEQIFFNFNCDILVTTRNVFKVHQLKRLARLNEEMKSQNRNLFFCVSLPAMDSYKKLEPNVLIPSPAERIEFIKNLHEYGIVNFLTIRPLCPNSFIPISEILRIIDSCYLYTNLVISSGIVVDKTILNRLHGFPRNFKYTSGHLMECLNNDIEMQYVDVDEELFVIQQKCDEMNLRLFNHSLPAISYMKQQSK